MVAGIGDEQIACGVEGETARGAEAGICSGPVREAGLPGSSCEGGHHPGNRHLPDRVVARVRNVKIAGGIKHRCTRSAKLCGRSHAVVTACGGGSRKGFDAACYRVDATQRGVAGVGDQDFPVGRDGQTLRPVEQGGLQRRVVIAGAEAARILRNRTVGKIQHADAVAVGDVHLAACGTGDAGGISKTGIRGSNGEEALAGARQTRSARDRGYLAGGGHFADHLVARVGNEELIGAATKTAQRDPARPVKPGRQPGTVREAGVARIPGEGCDKAVGGNQADGVVFAVRDVQISGGI